MSYDKLGNHTIVPAADLLNLASRANVGGDTRVGGESLGKRAGMEVLRDAGSGAYSKVIALGSASSDAWRLVDGSASYTPVNLLITADGSDWTKSTGCTYADGLLTADGVDDPTASQVVALKAGTYRVAGEATAEGTLLDHDAPKLTITGATDGELVASVYKTVFHATAAESATTREEFAEEFTLTVDQNVTFEISVVNEAGSLEAGSAYITFEKLEALPS